MDQSKQSLFSSLTSILDPPSIPQQHSDSYTSQVRYLTVTAFSLATHFVFYSFLQSYTASYLAFNLFFHCLIAVVRWKSSNAHNLCGLASVLYFVLLGPAAMFFCQGFAGFACATASVGPCIILVVTKEKKLAIILLTIELFKCFKIYPTLLYNIVVTTATNRDIMEIIQEELLCLSIMLPANLLVFLILFNTNLKVLHDFQTAQNNLEKANLELQRNLEERESFILSFSHEIRNPLNSVLGNVELAYEEAKDIKIKEKLKNSKICGDMLLSLINNLLDVAKAGLGKLEVHPKECEFVPIFKKVWTVCREIIRSKKLKPVLELEGEFPEKVMLDQYRLMQILFNLIGNAVKFTEQGEVRLKISWVKTNSQGILEEPEEYQGILDFPREPFYEDKRIKNIINAERVSQYSSFESLPPISEEGMTFAQKNKQNLYTTKNFRNNLTEIDKINSSHSSVGFEEAPSLDEFAGIQTFKSNRPGVLRIEVSDTGCGIEKKHQEKLFQKFSQFSNNIEKSKVGTGLGLWITKEICEKMGGKIELTSEFGKGATFLVELNCDPCLYPSQPNSDNQPVSGASSTSSPNKRIELSAPLRAMIVEDDFFNADVLELFFQRFNIEVVKKAKNGLEALKFYEESVNNNQPIHLITMDLQMPLMSGKVTCQEIRKIEKKFNLEPATFIVISGSTPRQEFEWVNEINEKPNYCLKKPVKKHDFDDLINKIISQTAVSRRVRKAQSLPLKPKKALFFNDTPFSSRLMTEALSSKQIQNLTADRIDAAFEKYKNEWRDINVVILDYDTDINKCLELSRRIQSWSKSNNSRLPLIYCLTHFQSRDFDEQCQRVGISKTFQKPISYQALMNQIKI